MVAMVASLAVSLVLAPIVLRALGDVRYGAWSFTESFIAYLMLFDLGVAAAIVRFTPRCLAKDDIGELNRIYSASLLFFVAAAVVATALGFGFDVMLLDRFLNNTEFRSQFHWLFRLLVCNFALSLPMSVYSAMLDGLGRFVFKSSVRTVVLVARVPLTLAAIRADSPLVALGLVVTGCTILENLVLACGVHSFLRGLCIDVRSIDRSTLRQVAGYSRDAFSAMLAGRLAFHTDAFVIAPILGPAAVTFFSLPARLVELSKSLLRSATTTLTSTFSALEAHGHQDRARAVFLVSSQAAWYTALPLAAGLLILGRSFLSIWVGPQYAVLSFPVLVALAIPLALSIAQSVAARFLYGTGQLKWFARATIAEGLSNLALSLALVGRWGITGVAVGTAIPHTIFCIWVIRHAAKRLSIGSYLPVVIKPILATLVPAAIWSIGLVRGIDGWASLFTYGAIGLAAYGPIVVWLIRSPKKRSEIDVHSEFNLRKSA